MPSFVLQTGLGGYQCYSPIILILGIHYGYG